MSFKKKWIEKGFQRSSRNTLESNFFCLSNIATQGNCLHLCTPPITHHNITHMLFFVFASFATVKLFHYDFVRIWSIDRIACRHKSIYQMYMVLLRIWSSLNCAHMHVKINRIENSSSNRVEIISENAMHWHK